MFLKKLSFAFAGISAVAGFAATPVHAQSVTLNVVVALTFTPVCVCEEAPVVVAWRPAMGGFALHAQVVALSVFDVHAAVNVTGPAAWIVDWLGVSEQPDGVPAAGGVAGLQVNVGAAAVPPKTQLQRFDGSRICTPPACAGATNAGAAHNAAAARSPTPTLDVTMPTRGEAATTGLGMATRATARHISLTNIENLPKGRQRDVPDQVPE
jgi:hypothetical protein